MKVYICFVCSMLWQRSPKSWCIPSCLMIQVETNWMNVVKSMARIIMVFDNCTNSFDVIMILIIDYQFNCKWKCIFTCYSGNVVSRNQRWIWPMYCNLKVFLTNWRTCRNLTELCCQPVVELQENLCRKRGNIRWPFLSVPKKLHGCNNYFSSWILQPFSEAWFFFSSFEHKLRHDMWKDSRWS